jgi:DNA-binding NarL/FixJ family response regulator
MEGLVGRGDDLAVLDGFLDRGPLPSARTLLIEGPPGIGKTSLWSAGIERARRRGLRVIDAQPAAADVDLGFLGVADLLRQIPSDLLDRLPTPQRLALVAAVEGDSRRHVARVMHPALLGALAGMVGDNGLLIAIDDIQWLDKESAGAVAFALRRLHDREVRVLLAGRSGSEPRQPDGLEFAIASEQLVIAPLGLDDTMELLEERTGLKLSRPGARRLHATTGGNPLFVLELGAMLANHPELGDLERIPLPDRIESLFEGRLRGLSAPARTALLAVTLAGESPWREITSAVGLDALDAAVDAGVLLLENDRVRVAHSLLADVSRNRAPGSAVRETHRALAEATEDPERGALHLALATHGPDAEVAERAATAAAAAELRGSNPTAAVLADHALRLTDPGSTMYPERLLAAARSHWRAGQMSTVVELLRPALSVLSSPQQRAEARLLIAECDEQLSSEQGKDEFRLALEELGEQTPALRSRLLATLSTTMSISDISSIAAAERYAEQAGKAAAQTGDLCAREESLAALCWARAMRGGPMPELLPGREADRVPSEVLIGNGVDRIEAVWLLWQGNMQAARTRLQGLLGVAEERGEEESYLSLRLHLCELELRSGRWDAANAIIDEWARELPVVGYAHSFLTRCRALLEVGRGDADRGRCLATEAARPLMRGGRWNQLEATRALGLSQLLLGDTDAADSLMSVWKQLRDAGIGNPGAFPVGADLAEALMLCGRESEAVIVAQELSDAALAQRHGWARAAAARAWGHVFLAQGKAERAVDCFREGAELFGAMDLPFDRGRSLTALGVAHRRARELRAARTSLEAAVAALDEIGSGGWAELARTELARVGGRRGGSKVLTATEQQVAQLVREGLANKQIAQRMVVSTSTVEAHLTRIYRKLGVGSRTELTRLLAEQSMGLSPIPDGDAQP